MHFHPLTCEIYKTWCTATLIYMTDEPKARPTTRSSCGRPSGAAVHRRHGEEPCEPCTEAYRAYQRARRAKERAGERTGAETKAERRDREEALGAAVVAGTNRGKASVTSAADLPDDGRPGYPNFLQAAGRKLWDDVTAEYVLSPASLAVLTSACRMTDQLERFTAALSSRSTFWFEVDGLDDVDPEKGIPVVVNGMIGEGRQLANAIRTSLNQIGVLKTNTGKAKGGALDELKRRREARANQAANLSTAAGAEKT